jgi:threonine dehydratase
VLFHGDDCLKAERYARDWAERHKRPFLSPYNNPLVVSGQGTVAVEILNQWEAAVKRETIDGVMVPVGGGGLISGIAGFLKPHSSDTKIYGCQPVNSAVMYESIQAGRILDVASKPTLSDGTAGGIEPGAITFDLCRRYVEDFVLVDEKEIEKAILGLIQHHHMLVEGAAALSVASFIKRIDDFREQNVVLVLSGARIGLPTLQRILVAQTATANHEGIKDGGGMEVRVNEETVTVFSGARAGDALRKYSPTEALLVTRGKKDLIDERGNRVGMDGELADGARLFTRNPKGE